MAHTCRTPAKKNTTPGDTWTCPTCDTYWRAAADPDIQWWRA